MGTTSSSFISYDLATKTYTIQPGARTADVQSLLSSAAAGTTFYFAAGKHVFTDTLHVTADNIVMKGAGENLTEFHFDYAGTPGHAIHFQGKSSSFGTLTEDAKVGDTSVVLSNASGLKGGDVIHIQQQNTREWLDANGYSNVTDSKMGIPINESLVEVQSVNGNVVTLKQPITHAMEADTMNTTVTKWDMVEGPTLSGFKVTFSLGESNPDSFTNAAPEYTGTIAIYMQGTRNASVTNVSVDEAPSHSMEFRTGLRPFVDHYTADGAINKDATGDGYGLQIAETYGGIFKNLILTDMRHAFVFSSWHTEVNNNVHIVYTNRDINYHGGPDYNNTVIVEQALYRSGDTIWRLVSPGGSAHPYTDISANTTLFAVAQAGAKQDDIYGWDRGAWLDGGVGNDLLHGGAGNDVILAGAGYDDIWLGGGSDILAIRPGTGRDDVWDFDASKDVILIDGFSGVSSFGNVSISTLYDGGARITVNGEGVADLHGVAPSKMTAANFRFNDPSVFTSPLPPGQPVVDGAVVVTNLTAGTDTVVGEAGSDVVTTWMGQLGSADSVTLGAGLDTLVVLNSGLTLDLSILPGFSGVDRIDLTASAGSAIVIMDHSFLQRTDNGSVIITYGSAGLGQLDTSSLTPGEFDVKWGTGSITVSLVTPTSSGGYTTPPPATTPTVTEPAPTGVAGITFKASSSKDKITGTAGDDTVVSYSAQLNSTDVINLGAGFDTLKILSGSCNFTSSLFPGLKGIDRIDLSGTGGNSVVKLDAAILNQADKGAFNVYFGAAGIKTLDTSALTAGTFNVAWHSDSVTVALKSTATTPTDGSTTPDPAPTTTKPTPVVIADHPEIALTSTVIDGVTVSLNSKTDNIVGTSHNDLIRTYTGQISALDKIAAGAGFDTLMIRSTSVSFDSGLYKGFAGIDHLDLSGAATRATVRMTNDFMARTDDGRFFITFDNNAGLVLDTSGVDRSLYKVIVRGNGDVNLSGGNDSVILAKGSGPVIHGNGGNDHIRGNALDNALYGGAGDDMLYGEGGNDVLSGGGGSDTMTGGSGADTFVVGGGAPALDRILDFAKEDVVDLHQLFVDNGLSMDKTAAFSGGYLAVKQDATGVTVAFDADGAAGKVYAMTDIVRMDGVDSDTLVLTAGTVTV